MTKRYDIGIKHQAGPKLLVRWGGPRLTRKFSANSQVPGKICANRIGLAKHVLAFDAKRASHRDCRRPGQEEYEMKSLEAGIAIKCLAIAFVWASNASAATINAASCSSTAVTSAIAAASNGDTVRVPAGTCTWSSPPSLPSSKGISLIGAGAGSTVITLTGTLDSICSPGKPHRISGFTFQNAPSITGLMVGGACSGMRIDNNIFQNFSSGADAIQWDSFWQGTGWVYGVVDHNTFKGSTNFRGLLLIGNNSSTWPASPLGTANAVYLENNVFDFTSMQNAGAGCVDSNYTSAYVFRNNTTKNCLVTAHGVCNAHGTISVEIYDNTLVVNGSSPWPDGYRTIHHQGSGEMMAYNNRFTASSGKSSNALEVTHYRSAPAGAAGCSLYPRCDGFAAVDGNRSPRTTYYGYACLYQPGRNGSNALSPIYVWNNEWSDNGAVVNLAVDDPWGSGTPSPFTHIQANRDFYNYVKTGFNGTSGTGQGTLASRPATCTTSSEAGGGVGYWATDTKTLYRCSATNTWTVQYRPYAYPHPLVGGTALPPPFLYPPVVN